MKIPRLDGAIGFAVFVPPAARVWTVATLVPTCPDDVCICPLVDMLPLVVVLVLAVRFASVRSVGYVLCDRFIDHARYTSSMESTMFRCAFLST